MSIPRPKFCVGEVVDCVSHHLPVKGIEILKLTFDDNTKGRTPDGDTFRYTGFSYLTTGTQEYWVREQYLRKRPHNYWQDSVWTPEEVTA